MISNEALEEMLKTLESDCIDDSEELLEWLAEKGPDLIREVLERRKRDAS